MTSPLEIAKIFINTCGIERPPRCIREIGNDNGCVPLYGYHRISLIGRALSDTAAGMGVRVGKNAQIHFVAVFPQSHVAGRVEDDDAALIDVGIKIVVADESGHAL